MHSNGVIWSSGKPGAITTHGSDLMRKEPSKPSNSKGKVIIEFVDWFILPAIANAVRILLSQIQIRNK